MIADPTAAAILAAQERERMAEERYEALLARWREAQVTIAAQDVQIRQNADAMAAMHERIERLRAEAPSLDDVRRAVRAYDQAMLSANYAAMPSEAQLKTDAMLAAIRALRKPEAPK